MTSNDKGIRNETIAMETRKAEMRHPRIALTNRWTSSRTRPTLVTFGWGGRTPARYR